MGWSIGYDVNWKRDIGYGVPATCDHPGCDKEIHRGIAHVCGGEPEGGEHGCGLHFCHEHLYVIGPACECERCCVGKPPFEPKPDHPRWVEWKLTDGSWQVWREENPDEVDAMKRSLECQRT